MSTEQNRQYKKSAKFGGKNYWIFDIKQTQRRWFRYLVLTITQKLREKGNGIG